MVTCKGCGAEILWATTAKGRNMPLSVPSKEVRFFFEDELPMVPEELVEAAYRRGFDDAEDLDNTEDEGWERFKRGLEEPRTTQGRKVAAMSTYLSHFADCPNADRFRG